MTTIDTPQITFAQYTGTVIRINSYTFNDFIMTVIMLHNTHETFSFRTPRTLFYDKPEPLLSTQINDEVTIEVKSAPLPKRHQSSIQEYEYSSRLLSNHNITNHKKQFIQ